MFAVNILCHLWDLVDGGVDAALDVVQGRIGAGGICVPLTAGVTRHLRFTPEVSPRWFTSRGGVFFQPDRSRYANTRCTPVMSDWLRGRNPLAGIAERCRERGLGLRAELECTNLGRIAERYPTAARKNVFGDPSPSQICLVNPDVTELIRALACDLCANYGIETVELTGLDAMWPPDNVSGSDFGVGARQLMALCFCESCRQAARAADVPVEAAARSVRVRLEKLFRTGRPMEDALDGLAADDLALGPFIAWYRERVGHLFETIRAASGRRVASHTRQLGALRSLGRDPFYALGADVIVCDYADTETESLAEWVRSALPALSDGQSMELQLDASPCFARDPQALVRNLTRVAELGLPAATLDCYGHLPEGEIEIVKQAVRFARRSAATGDQP